MKRIILCCDGTWQVSHNTHPSHAALIARSIPLMDSKGVNQLVYYQKGVGTAACKIQKVLGASTGEGVNDNIGCAYVYLCHNYAPGDEIYLFGFSRGAYTARAVAGLVCEFGLMTKPGLEGFGKVYRRYVNNTLDAEAVKNLSAKYERIANVPIKFIGVWDTVGALGVPQIYIFRYKPRLWNAIVQRTQTFQLHHVELYPNIEFARHALALDERRAPFSPTLWSLSPDNDKTNLKQVWFPGTHASIGGGDRDHGLSNITIAWMAEQLATNTDLQLNLEYLMMYRNRGRDPMAKPWGCADFEESYTGIYHISGSIPRRPGQYSKDAGGTTQEYVHRSVLVRINNKDLKYMPPDVSLLKEDEFGEIESRLKW